MYQQLYQYYFRKYIGGEFLSPKFHQIIPKIKGVPILLDKGSAKNAPISDEELY